jgi:hypothetical protein
VPLAPETADPPRFPVSIEELHVALPKLYGAPAYARPHLVIDTGPKPFDPDELPITAAQTDEERELAANLPAHAWAPGGAIIELEGLRSQERTHTSTGLTARAFTLRSIAGRLLGD